jgi:hypothetical protein
MHLSNMESLASTRPLFEASPGRIISRSSLESVPLSFEDDGFGVPQAPSEVNGSAASSDGQNASRLMPPAFSSSEAVLTSSVVLNQSPTSRPTDSASSPQTPNSHTSAIHQIRSGQSAGSPSRESASTRVEQSLEQEVISCVPDAALRPNLFTNQLDGPSKSVLPVQTCTGPSGAQKLHARTTPSPRLNLDRFQHASSPSSSPLPGQKQGDSFTIATDEKISAYFSGSATAKTVAVLQYVLTLGLMCYIELSCVSRWTL